MPGFWLAIENDFIERRRKMEEQWSFFRVQTWADRIAEQVFIKLLRTGPDDFRVAVSKAEPC